LSDKDPKEEWFERMILEGAIEFSGVDDQTGEMLYNFSPAIEETHPELFERMIMQVQQEIYVLWEKGFLSMNITAENPLVQITQKALDQASIESELTRDEQRSLQIIMMYMSVE
jgi:hypothetical protein